jgi:hypothetical protein
MGISADVLDLDMPAGRSRICTEIENTYRYRAAMVGQTQAL